MKSTEWSTNITIKKVDEEDGWPTFKIIVENVDSKATVLVNKKDLAGISAEIMDCLAGIETKGAANDD